MTLTCLTILTSLSDCPFKKKFGIVKYLLLLCITMLYFTLILVNIIVCFVISNAAQSREISQTKAFLVSFFLSPIVGMFVVAMSPVRKEGIQTNQETITNLPEYKKEDEFVLFFEKNFKWFFYGFIIIFILSGMWR